MRRYLAAVIALGLAVRVVVLLAFAEAPGDGPTRAANGYHWFLTHHASFAGVWLPGHEVLVGLCNYLIPDPAWAGRLLSLAAGALSLPLLAWLVGRLFGPVASLVAAAMLALNPMHVALSATSLSDTVGIAALLALVLAAMRLADRPGGVAEAGAWATALAASLVGASIRFEFWLVLPLLVVHQLARTRSWWRSIALALVMAPFTLLWLWERLLAGGLAKAYADAVSGAAFVGAKPVDLATGIGNCLDVLTALLGQPLLWLAVLGLAALALRAERPRTAYLDLALVLAVLAVESLFLAKFAADRGAALWPRYLMGEALLLLPFAALALAACLRPPPLATAAAVLALAAMPASTWWHRPDLYLVRAVPDATRAAAAWVAAQPGEPAFLMTRMSWQASYLPVLDRLPPDRYRILSDWLPDDELRDFVRDRRPAFVLTRADDAGLLAKLCPAAGTMPLADEHLATFDRIVALPLDPARCAPPPP